ncbi:hypothetical protein CYPRO_1410 [Cyclonatronum proteinivorum]|uniref:Uncharacterized protein n=1 Tax=Cyclonatronum proteinivorum TaxID=1457365 RepID=A0A345UJL4_9BACT|nr:hypothetical protein CYPRO_1410 [Cyclonatronum proteinivorum]
MIAIYLSQKIVSKAGKVSIPFSAVKADVKKAVVVQWSIRHDAGKF